MEENRKRTSVALSVELSFRNSEVIINPSPRTYILFIVTCNFMLSYTWNSSEPLFNPLKTQFFHLLSTNLLYWARWAHNLTLVGLSYDLWPYIYIYIYIYIDVCVCVCDYTIEKYKRKMCFHQKNNSYVKTFERKKNIKES